LHHYCSDPQVHQDIVRVNHHISFLFKRPLEGEKRKGYLNFPWHWFLNDVGLLSVHNLSSPIEVWGEWWFIPQWKAKGNHFHFPHTRPMFRSQDRRVTSLGSITASEVLSSLEPTPQRWKDECEFKLSLTATPKRWDYWVHWNNY